MGLVKPFTAEDVAPYRPYVADGFFEYNTFLITPPRVYEEEVWAGSNGAPFFGAIWGDNVENEFSPSSINLVCPMEQVHHPSYKIKQWRFSGSTGKLVDVNDDYGAVLLDSITVDPRGKVWWYGIEPDSGYGGPVPLDSTGNVDTSQAVEVADYGLVHSYDFNIDEVNDRVFLNDHDATTAGGVWIFKISDKSLVAKIYAPNETQGIVLTQDGFVYLIDELGWILVYDYDGKYYGAMRNPAEAIYSSGFRYGWDAFYKRLLYLPGTDSAVDGASTLRIQGFKPEPEPTILTKAIPRSVPRKNRKFYSFAHVCGAGAEPLASRRADITGDVEFVKKSDTDGDIMIPVDSGAAGSFDVDVEVE